MYDPDIANTTLPQNATPEAKAGRYWGQRAMGNVFDEGLTHVSEEDEEPDERSLREGMGIERARLAIVAA